MQTLVLNECLNASCLNDSMSQCFNRVYPIYNSCQGKSMNPTHPATLPVAAGQLPAVPLTLEGYPTLHQMMRFRWTAWRSTPDNARREITNEAAKLLAEMEAKSDGQSALFSLLG